MGRFELLEHTADIGFRACGATPEEMFTTAAQALMSLIIEPEAVEAREERRVSVSAKDREQLLVRFLSEILFLYDASGFVTKVSSVRFVNEHSLNVVLKGEELDPHKHVIRMDVKAITYHQLAIEQTDDGYCAHVFVDV